MSTSLFKKQLDHVKSIRTPEAQLISVYVPPGRPLGDVHALLRDLELKIHRGSSDVPDKNLKVAISSLSSRLNGFEGTPPANGFVLLFGEVGDRLHQQVIEPPLPVQDLLLKVGNEFYLEPLYRMANVPETYGILVMDMAEATLGYMAGTAVRVYTHFESRVAKKHHHGGMSSLRFERLRDNAINEYFKKVSDRCTEAFLDQGVKGIIIGGPGMTKNDLVAGNYLHHVVRKLVIGVVDVEYTDEYGLREAMNAAEGLLQSSEYVHEKNILDRFWDELGKDGLMVLGLEPTKEMLKNGQVETVIVSSAIGIDAIEEIREIAEDKRTELLMIDKESDQGRRFNSAIRVGGVLRYK